jgi:hypothetical protein
MAPDLVQRRLAHAALLAGLLVFLSAGCGPDADPRAADAPDKATASDWSCSLLVDG